MSAALSVRRLGRVLLLMLAPAERGNRLTAELADTVTAALRAARADDSVGACVLTGTGDVFCLGGDYQGAGPSDRGRAEYARALVAMERAMAELGKPLVAAVNGDAHAGGFGLVASCDLAVAADDATFGLPEAANGLFPFIALAAVKDALPKKLLFELIYSGRLMTAAETLERGLVNELVPRGAVVERAVEIAERAARHDPAIVALGRDLYYGIRAADPSTALEAARTALLAALAAKDRGRA